jgi:hypothetical protein
LSARVKNSSRFFCPIITFDCNAQIHRNMWFKIAWVRGVIKEILRDHFNVIRISLPTHRQWSDLELSVTTFFWQIIFMN